MHDVAKRAGVSQTTVSHVINGSRHVSPQALEAVQRAIEDTGYVNDSIARSLRTGKTGTIGLSISAMSNPYFGTFVHLIERQVTDDGMSLILVDTHDDPQRELKVTSELLARRPDAILLAPSAEPERTIDAIARRSIPMVLIDRVPPWAPDDRFDAIGVENTEAMSAVVEHLVALGHQRIGLIAGKRGLYTTEERVAGFETGLSVAGRASQGTVENGVEDDELDTHAVERLLASADPPTAIIGGNNLITIEVVRQLVSLGKKIPDDISLVSFDDFEWADLFHPRLTAVRQPVEELAERAVQLLRDRLTEPNMAGRVERIAPQMIVRSSTVPHPADA
ncbi:MAG: LacI family DNA-binding transcriptional regulator [Ilumatobacter sp.]